MLETIEDMIERIVSAVGRIWDLLTGNPGDKVQEGKVRIPSFRDVVHGAYNGRRFPPSNTGCDRF